MSTPSAPTPAGGADLQVGFDGGVLRLWRDDEDFAQRYSGRLSAGGTTIEGAWEICDDGTTWRHDFDLNYRKIA